MNPSLKKALFVIAFILLTLFLPAVVLLMFVDAAENFALYVIVYGVVIFGILGYIVASMRNMEKKLEETMEEIKMQNAAIAYRLTSTDVELVNTTVEMTEPVKVEAEPVNTANIPLNPADPLVMPEKKEPVKAADDGFDDFK